MFLVLALLFAASFAFGSIGNSGGLSFLDFFSNRRAQQDVNNSSTTSATAAADVAAAKAATDKTPKDPAAWATYGGALSARASDESGEARKKTLSAATAAFLKASELAPKDLAAKDKLAQAYIAEAANLSNEASAFITESSAVAAGAPDPTFTPGGFANQDALSRATDSIIRARQAEISAKAEPLTTKATELAQSAADVYLAIAEATPDSDPNAPNSWFQYGQAAQGANDTEGALKGYRKFLKLRPGDPIAEDVKSVVDQLDPPKTSSSSGTGAGATTVTVGGSSSSSSGG